MSQITKRSLEIPSSIKPGLRWNDHTEMAPSGRSIKMDNNVRVVGIKKIKTALGTYDALYVTTTGKGTFEGKPTTMTTEQWFVRGRGPVKQIVKMRTASGPEIVRTIEETKG